MAKKRRKRKRGAAGESPGSDPARSPSGGVLQSMRTGLRRAAGVEESKSSTKSNVFWTVLLLLALAFFLYRQYG